MSGRWKLEVCLVRDQEYPAFEQLASRHACSTSPCAPRADGPSLPLQVSPSASWEQVLPVAVAYITQRLCSRSATDAAIKMALKGATDLGCHWAYENLQELSAACNYLSSVISPSPAGRGFADALAAACTDQVHMYKHTCVQHSGLRPFCAVREGRSSDMSDCTMCSSRVALPVILGHLPSPVMMASGGYITSRLAYSH